MIVSKKILVFALVLCLVNISLCQDNTTSNNTTKTTAPDTTVTTTPAQTTESTTTKAQTTEPTTTKDQTTEPTTTKAQTTETTSTTQSTETTTHKETTQSSTVSTTTTTPQTDKVFTFIVPENSTEPCLRAKFSLSFEIGYLAEFNNTSFNITYKMNLDNIDSYSGSCNETFDILEVNFNKGWSVWLNYTLKDKDTYVLDTIKLEYDTTNFPNVTNGGKMNAMRSALGAFSTSKGMSYKCTSRTEISLNDEVKIDFRNYQGQPFMSSSDKSKDFDTAMECPADTTGTSKLVPIIVGSALAVLVILVLLAYIIGKRKHRPGYQQV